MSSEAPEARLLAQIHPERLPQHIAIIMDGNGRWARKRRLPRIAGHRAGMGAVQRVIEASAEVGIRYLTLYAFSVENWKRPRSEVELLMRLLQEYLRKGLRELNEHNIRLGVIGRVGELPAHVQQRLRAAVEQTRSNTGLRLTLALNYGGRAELVDAFRSLAVETRQYGLNGAELNEETIHQRLYTHDLPDPDLLIRTSGEMRVSNFLLWQIAYAEIWVTDTLWPDFSKKDLLQAIVDYQKRERRYGGLG
jgi:undecaprenyl diphosphate synthase